MTAPVVKRFQRMATITVGAVIALILIGSLVRMTGSGMGCPDWPKCFGQWVPPTDVSQLPADYQRKFAVAGREIAEFEAFKTWVEYLNRLFGVLVGILGVATLVLSFPLRKQDRALFGFSLGGLLLIIIAGGVGAYVVRTNLSEGMITIHMMIALGVLSCYLFALARSTTSGPSAMWSSAPGKSAFWAGLIVMALLISQIVMGTQVREQVDALLKAGVDRADWIDSLTGAYGIHKFSHYALSASLLFWISKTWRIGTKRNRRLSMLMLGFTGAEVLMGLGMHHFEVPYVLQPLHLLFATLLFATIFLSLSWGWPGMKMDLVKNEKRVHGN